MQHATDNNDEIANMILQDGYLPNKKLWRKWVMTQTLRFTCTNTPVSFNTHFIANKPYQYIWETTIHELKAIAKEETHDRKTPRQLFYNKRLILAMLDDYAAKIPTCNISDIYRRVQHADTYKTILYILTRFVKTYPMPRSKSKKPTEWINAFYGTGAYYTMDNLIKFHKCVIYDHSHNGSHPMTMEESLQELNTITSSCSNDKQNKKSYQKLYDVLQQFLSDNHVSIKMHEIIENYE